MTQPTQRFGELLKRLRKSAHLSQQALATAAAVSMQTIRRAEQSKASEPEWYRSTALNVFRAINNATRVSPQDKAAFLLATGLQGMKDLGAQLEAAVAEDQKSQLRSPAQESSTRGDVDRTTVHNWIDRMVDEVGPVRVVAAIEALAASWGVDLSPRIRADDPLARTYWVHIVEEADPASGTRTTIYSPHPAPSGPRSSAPRKARA